MIDGVEVKPLITYPDGRGFFREIVRMSDGIVREGVKQASVSYMHEGVAKAWHLHLKQVDWYYVVSGVLKVAVVDWRDGSPTKYELNEFIVGDNRPAQLIRVPPGVLHGMRVLHGPATLIYLASQEYDPGDDVRVPHAMAVYLPPADGKRHLFGEQLRVYDWASGPAIQ